ncbi:LapA family protein [Sneathiella aquimaris]|uniref:LapA family protein n=1 Tax=Sneathiella aquimaris TaxID=2599305 RepID=UPI00146A5892|nr:LapA family protein [Sneathiella aquimaris]
MKLISWIFLIFLGIFVITLSIGNRESVSFSLFPLPFVMDVPLFMLILAGGFLGVLLGAFRTWISDGKLRRENRQLKQEVGKLKGDLSRLAAEKTPEPDKTAQQALAGPDK